jgi:photosystem II stability/assembly factor-like uncharacterized protein
MKNTALSIAIIFLTLVGAASVTTSSYQDLRWRLLGPLRAGWSSAAEGIPDDPDTFYFGGVDGGVWKTTDAGNTWQPIADNAPFSSVGTLAIAPGSPRTIYVGTGHVDTRYDVMDGTGVFKTEDDGKSWIPLGLTDTRHCGRILIDPRHRDTILVAALGHLFGPNAERGVFRSEDGGRSWKKVLFINENTGAVDLAMDPKTPNIVYAAMWEVRQYPWQSYFQPQQGSGSGIWKSTDGGRTWHQTSRKGLPEVPLSRIGLAVAPQTKAKRVYASVYAEQNAGLYRSDDSGDSWQLMNSDSAMASTYFGKITADTKDPDVIYVTGQSLRRSNDGGKTFTIVKGSPGGDDYHFFWINPLHPEHRILASDQGTTVSVNSGATWTPWYNQATGQFYHLAADDRFPYWVYSGQQDSGTVAIASRSDYGQLTFRDWHPVGGDERDYDIPHPKNVDNVFGSGLGGRLSLWNAETGRVANVSPWPESSYGKRPTTVKYRYTWITPIAIYPRAPHTLYQGAQFLFASNDQGQSWQIISPDLSGSNPNAQNCSEDLSVARATECGYGVIFSIAPSSLADGLIWIGTDNGRVQITRNNGKTWSNVTPPEVSDWSKIASVDASPHNPATAYIAVDRHRLDDRRPYMYRTHDYGKTWTAIANGIPDQSWVNVVRQDLQNRNLLYAGTRTGMFVSFDDGDHWQPLQMNLPRTGVNDLLVHGNDLIVATQGRAIWSLDDVSPLRNLSNTTPPALLPPAVVYRLSRNENRDTPLPPEFPTTPNPPVGAIIDYVLTAASSQPITIEILDSKGEVIRTWHSKDKPVRPEAERYFSDLWIRPIIVPSAHAGHNRFVWNLRYEHPKSPSYTYSIAAVPGQDTPVVPQGMLVLPGAYKVRLSVDGKTYTQPLSVKMDPRSKTKAGDFAAQYAFYKEVTRTLADISPKYEEQQKMNKKFTEISLGKVKEASPDEIEKAKIQVKELSKFFAAVDALVSLTTDLEEADGPPSAAQRALYAESKKVIE